MRGSVEDNDRQTAEITDLKAINDELKRNEEIDTIEFPVAHMVLSVSLLPAIGYVIYTTIILLLIHFHVPLIDREGTAVEWRELFYSAITLTVIYHVYHLTLIMRTVTVNTHSIVVNGLELHNFPQMRFSSHWHDEKGSLATATYLVFGLRAYYAGPVASEKCKLARQKLEYALRKADAYPDYKERFAEEE